MAKYKALTKFYDNHALREPGEVFDYDDSIGEGADPEILQPVGPGPHRTSPRKFDIEGGAKLPLNQRAEIFATRQPSRDPK